MHISGVSVRGPPINLCTRASQNLATAIL